MKIFISSAIQETNTFSPLRTDLDLIRRGYYLHGAEIPECLKDTNTEINGFCDYFSDKPDVVLEFGTACWGVAAGKMTANTYTHIAGDIMQMLDSAMPVDGVLLALHGALVAENQPDCTGDLLQRVRARVGKDVPIAASLDYHANITEKMVENADMLVGFRTYPHVDFRETGKRAAKSLYAMVGGEIAPRPFFRKLPLMVPVENSETSSGVNGQVMERLSALDKKDRLYAASLFCCQPWLDVPEAGVSLLLYGDAACREEWNGQLDALEAFILEHMQEYFQKFPGAKEAVKQACSYRRPCILVDSGDITSAGGPGDSTVMLREFLARDTGLHVALSIVDPQTVTHACGVGIGARTQFRIGGGSSGYNKRVSLEAEVVKIVEEPSKVRGEAFSGVKIDAGRRIYLRAGKLHIVVAEYSSLFHDPQMLIDMGIDPRKMDIIVQKSHKLFRSAYQDIAKDVVILDTPGYTDLNLKRLPFQHISKSIYPFNQAG